MIHSYPWYIADWRGSEAVMAMTLEERGLYRETLDRCWEAGSLPVDESLLRKMCGVSAWEWKRSWPKVKAQFFEVDGRLHHLKVDERRPDLEEWHDNRREAGRKGGLKKWENQRASSANSSALANSYPSSSASTSTSLEEPPKPPTCASSDARDGFALIALPAKPTPAKNGSGYHAEWFTAWWAIYWRKEAWRSAEKAFRKRVKTEAQFEKVMSATKSQTPTMMGREKEHRPYGATWLNAERYEDEAPQAVVARPRLML